MYGLRPAKQGGSILGLRLLAPPKDMLRKAAVLIEHSSVGDKGNTPLHRGVPTLGAKPAFSRPSSSFEPMLTYHTEAREVALVQHPKSSFPIYSLDVKPNDSYMC